MAQTRITATNVIAAANYKDVKWVGKTKDGREVTIELTDAICLDNIDWALADKGEIVPSITFTATYEEATRNTGNEPWDITSTDGTSGASNMVLGYGIFYIGSSAVGLTRGGGKFSVERVYREIEADGDRGPVQGRISCDKSVAKLQMNLLEILDKIATIYPGLTSAAVSAGQ